ncbi:unnamed protein product [Durusdinium trenchii]|uniref:RING-type domain-containing protein n=1 Tax=Durusdinium trenchii TaxID=1381693 RepID=A0ABP0I2J8_9DINO
MLKATLLPSLLAARPGSTLLPRMKRPAAALGTAQHASGAASGVQKPTAVVTGAGSGIGRALSVLLASKGLHVLAVGRRPKALQETCELVTNVEAVPADVGTTEGRQLVAQRVAELCQGGTALSCVVHNAAVTGEVGSVAQVTEEDFSKTMAINVEGPLFLTRELLPLLLESKGRVLHISSGAAHRPLEGCLTYCTSKAALLQIMRCLDEELAPQGVRVGSAMPGVVDTPMQTHLRSQNFSGARFFRGLAPAEGAWDRPASPVRGGLDHPENVAAFMSWLLLEVPGQDFGGREWNIGDPETQRNCMIALSRRALAQELAIASPRDPPDGASLEATAAGEGHRGDGDAITFDSPPPFLVVSSAGCASVNGRYAHDGLGPAGKVKYKKVDGDPVIYFSRGQWRLNDEEGTDGWSYFCRAETDMPPLNDWESISVPRFPPAPCLSWGTARDLLEGDSVTIVKNDGDVDWSNCPEEDEPIRRLRFSAPWVVQVSRLRDGAWFYPTIFESKIAPLTALGFVELRGKKHVISDGAGSSSGEDAPPFLVVTGAGHPTVNGRYFRAGLHQRKPKYKQVGGNSIIFFESRLWRLNDEEDTNTRCYDGPEDDSPMPPLEWVQLGTSRYGAAPSLSLGTSHDLREGDSVLFGSHSEAADWSGCPLAPEQRLPFTPGQHGLVKRVHHDWLYVETDSVEKVAPLKTVKMVIFMERQHRISEGEVPQEIQLQLDATSSDANRLRGIYARQGEHNGKVMYQKVDGDATIFFDGQWKIGVRGVDDWIYCHPDDSLSYPPSGQWTGAEGSTDPVPTISTVPQAVLVANASASMNGRYARAEDFNGKPKFRQVGGSGVLHFDDGWKIKSAETSDDSYEHSEDSMVPPVGEWRTLMGGDSPRLSFLQIPSMSSAPRFFWVQSAGGVGESTNGCYVCLGSSNGKPKYWQMDGSGIIYFRGGHWKINYRNDQGGWYYQHPDGSVRVPPTEGWTTEGYTGDAEPAPSLHSQERYSAEGFQRAHPPFLVVTGAGHSAVNGRFAHVGFHERKPKYRQLGGDSIIFFEAGLWRLNDEENTRQRKYDGARGDTPLPPARWEQLGQRYGNAPSLSLGTSKDIQVGDSVVIVKDDADVDWSNCPEISASSRRLLFSPPWTLTVHRLQGDFFYPTNFPESFAPLAALGQVHLMGKPHRLLPPASATTSRSSTAAPASPAESSAERPEVTGGYDEDWALDPAEVDKLKCPICMLVARNAMAHDCGSVLFCEMCWVKCLAEDSKCPVCRKDGSSIAPAHFERRAILNLMVKCPNNCGESFNLCDKEKHLKDCSARFTLCPLCQEQVPTNELEAHYASNPGKHIMQIMTLLDEVTQLREEVKQLKEQQAVPRSLRPGWPGPTQRFMRAARSLRAQHVQGAGEVPQEILVQLSGESSSSNQLRGIYGNHGEHNDKVMYRKVDSTASIYFDGQWKIGLHGVDDWVYCHPDDSLPHPPLGEWTSVEGSTDPVPTICSVPQVLQVANATGSMNGRYARAEDFNGKPKFRQVGGSGTLHFDDGWKIKAAETSDGLYSHPDVLAVLPPSGEWTLSGSEVPIVLSPVHVPISTAPRFLWVQGAGGSGEATNGCYVHIGSSNGKPKYWQMEGKSIIFFRRQWKITDEDDERGWYYQHPDRSAQSPPTEGWTTEGYMGSAAPPSLHAQQRLSRENLPTTAAAAGVQRVSPQATTAAVSLETPEVTGGYDEDWADPAEVDKLKCPICMLVARNAMAHDCGSVLFCEMCWVKCLAEDSKCPVCRKDGSSIVPAHFERRAILNLMVKCPNNCGESFNLCDKEKHLKDCRALSTTCPLCNVQVPTNELEAHYASNPGKHILQIVALLDEVTQLREEVKQLKEQQGGPPQ